MSAFNTKVVLIATTLLLASCAFSFGTLFPGAGGAPSTARASIAAEPPDLASQLRYIGRDTSTGLPAPVDDRFIADQEEAIERYGKDEVEAIAPPPVSGADIAFVRMPDINASARLARFGVDRYGRLDVPQDRVTVGWNPGYSELPGSGGATFFAAHYEYAGSAGVFFRLSALQPGAEVEVGLSDGAIARYRVSSTIDYPLGAIDMGAILHGREGMESITLMTCSGPPNEGEYPLRTVVLADRID